MDELRSCTKAELSSAAVIPLQQAMLELVAFDGDPLQHGGALHVASQGGDSQVHCGAGAARSAPKVALKILPPGG